MFKIEDRTYVRGGRGKMSGAILATHDKHYEREEASDPRGPTKNRTGESSHSRSIEIKRGYSFPHVHGEGNLKDSYIKRPSRGRCLSFSSNSYDGLEGENYNPPRLGHRKRYWQGQTFSIKIQAVSSSLEEIQEIIQMGYSSLLILVEGHSSRCYVRRKKDRVILLGGGTNEEDKMEKEIVKR